MNGSPLLRSRWCSETRDQRRPSQIGKEPLVVVWHAHELDEGLALAQPSRVDERVTDAPVTIFGASGAAHVYEVGVAHPSRVWHVRVPEEDRRVRVIVRHPLHGGGGSILKEVLVDAARAAVHGEDVAAGSLQHEVVLERAEVRLDLVADGRLGPRQRCRAFGALLIGLVHACLLYTSPSPRDRTRSRMPSSA